MLQTVFAVLSGALNIFSTLIFIRILLSWFDGGGLGRPFDILCGITDPYLDYFRRFTFLRVGGIDLSPIAALAVLSIVNDIVSTIARFGRISLGIIFAIGLSAVWSAASFIIGFFTVVLILRLIAYIVNANTYAPFWRIIDSVVSPIQFRVNRIIFKNRIVNYLTGLIVSIAALVLLWVSLGALTRLLENFLVGLPV
ncbi:MAG: YggT family protein [Spirochaetaceae bacterium]|nr:YggT family protein [Spirochaetaceae bacterium]